MSFFLFIIFSFGLNFLGLIGVTSADQAIMHTTTLSTFISDSCIPDDDCWPPASDWNLLNSTVEGKLMATSLLADVCHDPHYNASACSDLKKTWDKEVTHFSTPESFMAPLFQNQTCDPFTAQAKQCTAGNYAVYSINVSSASDVIAGIKFAREKNIRLVIKNTGHEYIHGYLGKSSGKGSLSLWTHNLKSISFSNYSSSYYEGAAIKIGAGVHGYEAYTAANSYGLRVVGGECPTVGLAGGFTSGGGHSSFSSIYGMAADQALEWEVVTANGTHLIATPQQNSDLYWALSGGGAGTYAVVLSLTSKVYPDGNFGGVGMTIFSANISSTTFWTAVELWEAFQLNIVDAGGVATWFILPFGLLVNPIGLPDKTKSEVDSFMGPFLSKLNFLGINQSSGSLQINTTSFPTFFDHYFTYNGPYPYGAISSSQVTGGRLLPRSTFENSMKALTNVTKFINNIPGMAFGGFTGHPTLSAGNTTASSNAVLPAWRDSVMSVFIIGAWNFTTLITDNLKLQKLMTDVVDPALKSISRESGTYLNEANFQEPNWKEEFYGANYEMLVEVKRKYDPEGLFYAVTAVGSDGWETDGDGRLCHVNGDVENVSLDCNLNTFCPGKLGK
ncbi:FAD-binding domain-containing protein [Stipitochalara longipes BDJ]|nr:FAD-binding domain-containing protein [Stipitochalara longipes BDJ]